MSRHQSSTARKQRLCALFANLDAALVLPEDFVADVLRLVPATASVSILDAQLATAVGVLIGERRAPAEVAAAWRRRTEPVVVLSDGETWTTLSGCRLVMLSEEELDADDVDEIVKDRYRQTGDRGQIVKSPLNP